jgi:hypothetical protein
MPEEAVADTIQYAHGQKTELVISLHVLLQSKTTSKQLSFLTNRPGGGTTVVTNL